MATHFFLKISSIGRQIIHIISERDSYVVLRVTEHVFFECIVTSSSQFCKKWQLAFVMSVRLPFCPSVRMQLNDFTLDLISAYLPKTCLEYTNFIKFGQYCMIYLLTVIGLSPGCSSAVHIYTQTTHRTIQNKQYIE